VMMAREEDIILVAGKGHEKYQEIKGERFPFDDRTVLLQTISELEK
jgi:UDP-N-acetylmuramoyl-L-alanyl-D-glutamate--2,6-diaminopimelate ligase